MTLPHRIAWLATLVTVFSAVNSLCRVKELTETTQSKITAFGPLGKFRLAGGWAGSIVSMPRGEVELEDGKMYLCNKQDNWNEIPKLVGVYYKLYTIPARPEQVEKICFGKGGEPATVYNTRINNVMAAVMRSRKVRAALIGISDKEQEGNWVWSSGHKTATDVARTFSGEEDVLPADAYFGLEDSSPDNLSRYQGYTNWYPGQPNNWGKGEDYAVITTFPGTIGKWYDIGPPALTSNLVRDPDNPQKRVYPLRVPFWCQLTLTDDHFVSNSKLVLGDDESEGLLVIERRKDEWSAVCFDKFTSTAARVVCRSLGYLSGDHSEHTGESEYRVGISEMECEGEEESILDCSHSDSNTECDAPVWIECHDDCPAGMFLRDDVCVPCPTGRYSSQRGTGECAKCEVGFYQDLEGQSTCKKCPDGRTTDEIGSVSVEECVSPPPPDQANCGVGYFEQSVLRIIGGSRAEEGEFPWHVTVNIGGSVVCGGSLIDKYTVLTAAHCLHLPPKLPTPPNKWQPICHASNSIWQLRRVIEEDKIQMIPGDKNRLWRVAGSCEWRDKDTLTVTAGATDRDEDKDKTQTRDVAKVYVSQRYVYIRSKSQHNDIAVLKLKYPFDLNSRISTVCLPTPNYPIKPGNSLTVTGFGVTEFSFFKLSKTLMKAHVPLVDSAYCNNTMSGDVSENMICAGYAEGGIDSCQGDSGGPLLHKQTDGLRDRYTILGVVSWGVSCATPDRFGVYTDVRNFLQFIEDARTENQNIREVA